MAKNIVYPAIVAHEHSLSIAKSLLCNSYVDVVSTIDCISLELHTLHF